MVAVEFTLTKLGDKERVEAGKGGLDCLHGNCCSGWCITQFGTQGGFCASAVGSTDAGLFVV